MDKDINITLKVWRQKGPNVKGQFETYQLKNINQGTSFLEMLDILNEQLISEGKEPVVFDHDCREHIGEADIAEALDVEQKCALDVRNAVVLFADLQQPGLAALIGD